MPDVPGGGNFNELNAQLQESMEQNNTAMRQWVKDEVKADLHKYHQAAASFATTHSIANLEDVQVSGVTDGRIVIVLNAVEFDGLQDVLRGQREIKKTLEDTQKTLQETQDQLTDAQDEIRILKQQGQTQR
ncbi:unnamed protein product, partial [Tilletia laevis]